MMCKASVYNKLEPQKPVAGRKNITIRQMHYVQIIAFCFLKKIDGQCLVIETPLL